MKPVIEINELSKLYFLDSSSTPTLIDSLGRWWSRLTNKDPFLQTAIHKNGQEGSEELNWGPEPNSFWALKDVSLSIQQGEVIGILGRNGSGKSTLLKILSRITAPTSGYTLLRGRMSSVLEMGVGFHPEMTGRENIYMSGIILGMRKREVDRKLDEIVSFAEIEPFIDMPVKHYSSGMHARLGFSVAAHLNPEILLLDEALTVGDVLFQSKCFDKIQSMTRQGMAVMFVSHNIESVQKLSSSVLFLEKGRGEIFSDCETAIGKYLTQISPVS